jgi:RNA polymerase sigma factor (sigma-70 family)
MAGGSEHFRRPLGVTPCLGISRTGGTVIVTIPAGIGLDDWLRVDAALGDLIDAQGNIDIVVDLCEVPSLEPAAVALILHAARRAHDHGGRLRVADRACAGRRPRSAAKPRRPILGTEFDSILEAAQSGAGWACTRIYESLGPAVAGYLRAQGADDPDGLTSEVFLRVFGGCRSFSGNEAQFRSWVFTIAHHRMVDARRAKNRAPEVGALDDECLDGQGPTTAGAEDEAMQRLAMGEVHQLLDALTSDQRDVLALRVLSQMSVEEVATALGKPPGAIKALQRRALATLRRRLVGEVVQP